MGLLKVIGGTNKKGLHSDAACKFIYLSASGLKGIL